jgi:hypothetical protein
MFDPETKCAASVVQIVFGRTEAGWWPALESGRRRNACGGKRFGPEVNINTLLGAPRVVQAAGAPNKGPAPIAALKRGLSHGRATTKA